VFEADRRGLIKTISLELGTNTIDPAVGKRTYVPFVAVATGRERFMDIDLAEVVPSATLQHLGAVVAKSPFDLAAIDPAGVRKT
jgi:restriction system protein